MKPAIGLESQFLPTPPAFDALVMEVPVGILPWCLVQKNQNGMATDGEKIEDMIIHFDRIHERDGRTDTHKQTRYDGIGRAYA